jgi:hypothetical protein
MLEENNRRKGFFETDQCEAVLRHLSDDLKPVFAVTYITRWRVKDEILTRQNCHLDLKAGWLRLEPGETKNNEGRMFPISTVPRLRDVLARQLARTESVEKATNRIIPWLFHRKGRPIKSFRRAWRTACKNAEVPGRIPHDFRRTAIRNLERAGIPRSAAMAMVGHKTESVYRRYAIVEEGMLNEAGVKLQTFYGQRQGRNELCGAVFPSSGSARCEGVTRMVQVWGKSEGFRELFPKHRPSEVRDRTERKWWAEAGLNRRHQDFQLSAPGEAIRSDRAL